MRKIPNKKYLKKKSSGSFIKISMNHRDHLVQGHFECLYVVILAIALIFFFYIRYFIPLSRPPSDCSTAHISASPPPYLSPVSTWMSPTHTTPCLQALWGFQSLEGQVHHLLMNTDSPLMYMWWDLMSAAVCCLFFGPVK